MGTVTEIYIKGSNKSALQKMQRAGFNVTTCGNCGEVKLQDDLTVDELTCDYCGFEGDICDFPDLEVVAP